jgi:integrase
VPISRFACLSCQVLFPLAREVEICVQEIHPEVPFSIWPCLSPLTTRGGSETFQPKPLMTPSSFNGLRHTLCAERLGVLGLERLRESRNTPPHEIRFRATLGQDTVTRGSFKPLLEPAGLESRRFHDLRHTYATLLLSRGVHPKYVQELLGRSSIAMTLDRYSRWIPSMGDHAARAMEAALN